MGETTQRQENPRAKLCRKSCDKVSSLPPSTEIASTQIEGRIQQSLAQVDAARTVLHASADPLNTNPSPALFHWNEEMDYVVVPKEVLKRITFDTLEDSGGSKPVHSKRSSRFVAAWRPLFWLCSD